MDNTIQLPDLVLLDDFGGDYEKYIQHVYGIFREDFESGKKIFFRGLILKLKYNPMFQGKACTFYHMTHEGEDEQDRKPDIRRCERLAWAKPVIENCDRLGLKVWPQKRKGKNRICIWVELEGEPDYIVILEIREKYCLLWTTFILYNSHEKRKKLKEYTEWLKTQKSLDINLTTS